MSNLPPIKLTRYPQKYEKICTGCGACCRRIDKALPETRELLKKQGVSKSLMKFPYKWDETGKCENLDENGKCSIYDTRPNICRVDWIIEKAKLDKNTFYPILINSCNKLMDDENIDEKFRIIDK